MDLDKWAEREIEIVCKDRELDAYAEHCYKEALKIFKSITKEYYSGYCIRVIKGILNDLIDLKCLSPLKDDADCFFEEINYDEKSMKELGARQHFQSTRCNSLFKTIREDGSVEYTDVERVKCFDADKKHRVYFSNGEAERMVNKMFPITFPYCPGRKYLVAYKDDKMAYIITPNNKKVEIK